MSTAYPDVNAALLEAAELGDTERVAQVLEAGADIDYANEWGFSALSSALWGAQGETVALLLERGAEVDIEQAAALGYTDVLAQTWPTGAESGDLAGPFLMACRAGAVSSIKWFVGQGFPVDLHPSGEEWGGVGCPGLHHACVNGCLEAVETLLAAGADPALVDDVYGSTALAWAASAGHMHVVDVLLAAAAEPEHRNSDGLGAADLARSNGWTSVATAIEAHSS